MRPRTFHHCMLAPLPSAGKLLNTVVWLPLWKHCAVFRLGMKKLRSSVMHLTRSPPPESPGKGMCLDTGAGLAGVAFLRKKKGRASHVRWLCRVTIIHITAPHARTHSSVSVQSRHSGRTMAPAFPADDQSASLPLFSGLLFLYRLTSLLGDGFIPTLFVRASSKNVGRR